MISWLIFGALAVPAIGHWFEWPVIGYALQPYRNPDGSGGPGAPREWFRPVQRGIHRMVRPRGVGLGHLCSPCLEDLGPAAQEVTATIALTVLLSVGAHGLTARPFARHFVSRS